MNNRRDLEPIGSDVEALLGKLGMPPAVDLGRLVTDWEEVAGPPFAGVSAPVGIDSGELIVEVADGAAASLLKYRIGPLLDRLTAHFGEGIVDRVKIRVGRRKNHL